MTELSASSVASVFQPYRHGTTTEHTEKHRDEHGSEADDRALCDLCALCGSMSAGGCS